MHPDGRTYDDEHPGEPAPDTANPAAVTAGDFGPLAMVLLLVLVVGVLALVLPYALFLHG